MIMKILSVNYDRFNAKNFAFVSSALLLCVSFIGFDVKAVNPAEEDITATVTQPPPAQGSKNVLVTFGELATDPATPTPFTHRGVTYTTLKDGGSGNEPFPMSVVIGKDTSGDWPVGIPVTRFLETPLLATVDFLQTPGGKPTTLAIQLDFEKPTPFFGFGYGFNALDQNQMGNKTPTIGKVILKNRLGKKIAVRSLRASRLYCCTEGRFDYTTKHRGSAAYGHVKTAIIKFKYDYKPFQPGVSPPQEAGVKFFGIDSVSYSIPATP